MHGLCSLQQLQRSALLQLTWSSFGGCHGFHLGRMSFRSSVLPDVRRWSRDRGVCRHSMGAGTGRHQHALRDAAGAAAPARQLRQCLLASQQCTQQCTARGFFLSRAKRDTTTQSNNMSVLRPCCPLATAQHACMHHHCARCSCALVHDQRSSPQLPALSHVEHKLTPRHCKASPTLMSKKVWDTPLTRPSAL